MVDGTDQDKVVAELVRLANEDTPLSGLTNGQLLDLAAVQRRARRLLQRVVLELNERGVTFAEIGEHFNVHESTAYRWAYPHTREGS